MHIFWFLFFICIWEDVQSKLFLPNLHRHTNKNNSETRSLSDFSVFTQKVDNFNSANTDTWNNRYIDNTKFFKPGGPIFIMLAGESSLSDVSLYTERGFMHDLAQKTNAYIAILEHRFYGESIPGGDMSTTNLKYLTVEQTLADTAAFIQNIKTAANYSSSKVVVFGGSYAGILSTLMRQSYPQLVNVAMGSSAPLHSVVDFSEYLERVATSLNDPDCVNRIHKVTKYLQDLTASPSNFHKIYQDFKLCNPINPVNPTPDITALFQELQMIIGSQVQYGNPKSISEMCLALAAPPDLDNYSKLANFVAGFRNIQKITCLPGYDLIIADLKNTSNNQIRPWFYQQCTQLGDFITTSSTNQPFPDTVPKSWWLNICQEVFNIENVERQLSSAIANLEKVYGGNGEKPSSFNNIVSSQGSLDPWNALGLHGNVSDTAPLVVIQNVSHTADLSPANPLDSPTLVEAREIIAQHIINLLK